MPKNDGGFGWVSGKNEEVFFSTQSINNREHNWTDTEIHEDIEFNMDGFDEFDEGIPPTAEQLYEKMGPRQKKWAKKGADWKVLVRVDEYNFKTRIGSDEEDILMDRESHIGEIKSKVALVRKWEF